MHAAQPTPMDQTRRGFVDRIEHRWDLLLLATPLVIAAGYLLLGIGPVLDDWFALRNAHFDGALRAAGADQIAARPLGSLMYALVFGVFGRAVAPTVLLMAVMNGLTAALFARLLRAVAPAGVAVAAAWLWLVLPTTTSIEVWASASNISLGLVLSLTSLSLVDSVDGSEARRRMHWTLAALAAAGAVLSYEALLVLILGGAAALVVHRRDRGRVMCTLGACAGASAAFTWTVLHWHPRKNLTSVWGDVTQVLPANLGTGIAPGATWMLIGLPIMGLTVMAVLPSWRHVLQDRAPLLVLGWFLMLVGVLPFVKYTYAPVGAGDRVDVISSLGGAVLVACLLAEVGRHRQAAVAVAAVAIAALSLPIRVREMRPWADAADDASLILGEVRTRAEPGAAVVIGPQLVDRGGVTAIQLPYIAEAAIQLVLDDAEAAGTLTDSLAEFRSASGIKIDLRHLLASDGTVARRSVP